MEGLNKLEFEPSPRTRALASAWRVIGLVLLIAAGASLLIILFNNLLPGPAFALSSTITIVAPIVFIAFVILLARDIAVERLVAIRDGSISLEFPLRHPDGSRTRQVPMSDIVDVGPNLGSHGGKGVDVLLSDGSRFFLAQSSFGAQGREIMETLCEPFGHSYLGELRKILLEGKRFKFHVVKPVEVRGDAILLSKRVNTFSGMSSREVPLADIQLLEKVSTHYAGEGILVTLVDGTQLTLPESEATAAGLAETGALASKFRPAP